MDCNEVRDALEEYTLGTLDLERQRAVARHLANCADCRRLATEYVETWAILPEALAAASPQQLPDALKDRILGRIVERESERAAFSAENLPIPPRVAAREHNLPSRRDAGRAFLFERVPARASWTRLRVALAIVGLLFIFSFVWSIRLNVVLARERALLSEYAELVDQQEIVLEIIDSTETTRRVLRPPQGVDSRAYGKVFTRSGFRHVVAMAARLPATPPGEAYHLWLTRDGQTWLAGLLRTNPEGFGLLIWDDEVEAPEYDLAQVTLQPIGASEPESPPVLEWRAE